MLSTKPGVRGWAAGVNGLKLSPLFGLLRNSTIFRYAKNWDSNSTHKEGQALLAESPRKEGLACGRSPAASPPLCRDGGDNPQTINLGT